MHKLLIYSTYYIYLRMYKSKQKSGQQGKRKEVINLNSLSPAFGPLVSAHSTESELYKKEKSEQFNIMNRHVFGLKCIFHDGRIIYARPTGFVLFLPPTLKRIFIFLMSFAVSGE